MFFFGKRRFGRLVDEKKAAKEFGELRGELEKGDLKAMVIAALITFLPLVLAVAGILLLFARWLAR